LLNSNFQWRTDSLAEEVVFSIEDAVYFKDFEAHEGDEDSGRSESEESRSTVVFPQTEVKVEKPRMYRVLLHNDDYTPMEFVVSILEAYFDMEQRRANQIMLDVHRRGVGVCGVYTKEVAETKTVLVTEKAKMHQYPLKCTHEVDRDAYDV